MRTADRPVGWSRGATGTRAAGGSDSGGGGDSGDNGGGEGGDDCSQWKTRWLAKRSCRLLSRLPAAAIALTTTTAAGDRLSVVFFFGQSPFAALTNRQQRRRQWPAISSPLSSLTPHGYSEIGCLNVSKNLSAKSTNFNLNFCLRINFYRKRRLNSHFR